MMINYICERCGTNLPEGMNKFCPECGHRFPEPILVSMDTLPLETTPRPSASSSMPLAALILSILGLLICWVPMLSLLGMPLSALGLIMALLGLNRNFNPSRAGGGYAVAALAIAALAILVAYQINGVFGNLSRSANRPANMRADRTQSFTVAAPSPTPALSGQWRIIKTWQGNGEKNTDPFTITGPQWRISWKARQTYNGPGVFNLHISPHRVGDIGSIGTANGLGPESTYFYETGTFYLDITPVNTSWWIQVEEFTAEP
jgi:hypothetical protein